MATFEWGSDDFVGKWACDLEEKLQNHLELLEKIHFVGVSFAEKNPCDDIVIISSMLSKSAGLLNKLFICIYLLKELFSCVCLLYFAALKLLDL